MRDKNYLCLVKKEARTNFAIFQGFEGGEDYEEESSSSAGYHTDEGCSLTPEPALIPGGGGGSFSAAERLAEMYSALYDHAHLHTLDALDALPPLDDAPDLKAKILYSVVVVSKVRRLASPPFKSNYYYRDVGYLNKVNCIHSRSSNFLIN